MQKNDLIAILNDIFTPLGFKKKSNNWIYENQELIKVVNLQKSNYSNSFYVNYGFIIKGLELTTKTHVENRLGGSNKEEQAEITNLLDFESNISDNIRTEQLKSKLATKIVYNLLKINTQSNLLEDLKNRSNINNIPLIVKKHFRLV